MTDGLNELGKSLGKTNDDAGKAVRRKYPQYGMQESARDIFDTEVPYTMHYRVQPTNKKTTLHLAFELPPPDAGLGTCCADCYCAVCEVYESDDEAWSTTILLARPYVAGSVRLIMSDFQYPDGITETDPEAGIVTINNVAFTSGRTLTICYVYKYDVNCTTNLPDGPIIPDCYTDLFDRTIAPNATWGLSNAGYTWAGDGSSSWVEDGEAAMSIHAGDEHTSNNFSELNYLAWGFDLPTMNILLIGRFDRTPSVSEDPPDEQATWGDYIGFYAGDTTPFGTGKFVVYISGNFGLGLVPYNGDGDVVWTSLAGMDLTEEFYVRITRDESGTALYAKAWQVGDEEPEDPMLTHSMAGYSNHGLSIQLETNNGDSGLVPLTFYLGTLAIEGLCG